MVHLRELKSQVNIQKVVYMKLSLKKFQWWSHIHSARLSAPFLLPVSLSSGFLFFLSSFVTADWLPPNDRNMTAVGILVLYFRTLSTPNNTVILSINSYILKKNANGSSLSRIEELECDGSIWTRCLTKPCLPVVSYCINKLDTWFQ